MPIAFSISDRAHLVIGMSGALTVRDFADFFAASLADPRYAPGLDRLVLVQGVERFPAAKEIRGIAARIRDRVDGTDARFAIVTTDPLAVGVVNMLFSLAALSGRYAIFESADDAHAWLANRQ